MCRKHFFLSDNQRAWKCLELKRLLYSSQLICSAPDYASPSAQDQRGNSKELYARCEVILTTRLPKSVVFLQGIFSEEKIEVVWQNRLLPQTFTTPTSQTQRNPSDEQSPEHCAAIALGQLCCKTST